MIYSRTRGSLSQTSQSTHLKESPLVSSVLSAPVLSPSTTIVPSPSPPLCTKAVSSPSSFCTSSDTSCSGTSSSLCNNELILNVWESTNDDAMTNVVEDKSSTADDINVSESFVKKKITPPPDIFHSSKKRKQNNDIEIMLKQSSVAFQDAAKAVSSLIPTVTETEQRKNSYAGAIIAALEHVSTDKILDCFLAIMNTIKQYYS